MTARRPGRRDTGPPPVRGDEKAVLLGFLNYLRDSIAGKLTAVPEPQVRTAAVPSGTNLLGLIKHLTAVERYYFLGERSDNWRRTMRPAPEETAGGVLAGYRDAIARANQVIEACADLTRPARRGPSPSMRWTLVHMIEETGRHAGHADIIREQLDGSTGR